MKYNTLRERISNGTAKHETAAARQDCVEADEDLEAGELPPAFARQAYAVSASQGLTAKLHVTNLRRERND